MAFFPLTEDTFAFLDFSNLKFAIVNLSAFVVGGKNFSVLPLGWKEKEFLILFFNSSIDKTFLVKLNEDAAIEYYNIKGLKNAQIKSYNKDGDEILLSCNFEWEKPYEDYIFSLKEEKFIKTNELPGAKGFLLKKAYNLFLPKDLFYDLARGLFDLKGLYELNKKKINLPFYEHVEHCVAEDDGLYFTNVEFYKDYLVLFGHGISVFKIKSLLSEKGIEFGGLKEAVLKDNTIKFSWDLPEISNYLKGNVAICLSKTMGFCKKSFKKDYEIKIQYYTKKGSLEKLKNKDANYALARWEYLEGFYDKNENEVEIVKIEEEKDYNSLVDGNFSTYWYKWDDEFYKKMRMIVQASRSKNFFITRCSYDDGIDFWSFSQNEKPHHILRKKIEKIYSYGFIANPKKSGYIEWDNIEKKIRYLKFPEEKIIWEKDLESNPFKSFSQNGEFFITFGYEDNLKIFDVKNGKEILEIDFPPWTIKSVSIDDNSKKIAIIDSFYINIYNFEGDLIDKILLGFNYNKTYNEKDFLFVCQGPDCTREFFVSSFSPDGKKILIAKGNEVKIFDLIEKNIIANFYFHYNVSEAIWNPSGNRVILIYNDRSDVFRYGFYDLELQYYRELGIIWGYFLSWIGDNIAMTFSGIFNIYKSDLLKNLENKK